MSTYDPNAVEKGKAHGAFVDALAAASPVPGDRVEPTNGSDELRGKAITAVAESLREVLPCYCSNPLRLCAQHDTALVIRCAKAAVDAVLPLLAPPGETDHGDYAMRLRAAIAVSLDTIRKTGASDPAEAILAAALSLEPRAAPPGETWTEYRVVWENGSVPKGYDSPLPKLENAQYRASDLTWKDSLNENYGRTVPDGRPYRVQSSTVARTAWTDVEADPTEEP